MQQKACTGNAVVKSGKLYMVKRYIDRHFKGCTPKPEGKRLEVAGNGHPREMIRVSFTGYRIRLIGLLFHTIIH